MVGLGGLWLAMDRRVERGDWPAAAAAPVAAPTTLAGPILSLRRAPVVLAREQSDRLLAEAVKPVTDSVDDTACFAASLEGRTVIADGADLPVLPGSNVKLVTAAVALEVLGPDFTFDTRAAGTVEGDTVVGDLFLIGGGDPLLASRGYSASRRYRTLELPTRLESLADQVAARVRVVSGRVVGDESHFDAERFNPGWEADVRGAEAGPLSGLLINDARQVPAIDTPVDDPALAAADELTRLLRDRGVLVGGDPAVGVLPGPVEELGRISSVPLSQVVAEMLTNSDNNTAELVLKEIGARRSADGIGTRPGGLAVVQETLAGWGVPLTAGTVVTDGSGLDRGNRLTCRILVGVLDHAGPSGPLFDGLSVVGSGEGTLDEPANAAVFEGLGVDGRVHAKTGSLRDVKALSGFFDLADGRQITFSLLVNGDNAALRGRLLWAAMATSMAAFTGPLSPGDIALAGA